MIMSILVIPAPIVIGINSSRNPVLNGSFLSAHHIWIAVFTGMTY
jgi:hypothetical protein